MSAPLTRNDARKIAAEPYATERSLGDWTKALYRGVKGDPRGYRYLEDRYRSKAAMSSTSGITGGYLVPVEFVKDMLAVAQEESVFLREAMRVPLTSAETTIPHVSVNSGAAGVTPFFGGASFGWGVEGASLSETAPTFSSVSLKGHTLAGYTIISNQLLEDGEGGELSSYLTTLFGEAAAWYYDHACFRGTGTAAQMPLGVIHAPGKLTVTRAGANDVAIADLAGMSEKLIPSGWARPHQACWAMHPSVLAKLFALTGWQLNVLPGTEAARVYVLYGLPVYVTEKLPALGTAGDILLFIPKLYCCAIRQEVEVSISRDEPTLFLKGQSAVRVVLRGDGQPRLGTSVTLADGTKTASAYVTLN